ncbi:phage baseplate assembly protein V [Demequina sp. SYSU T00192]|uniref:Phage baseplate assembly protein V n=1 Tax=Demequina litoralis TaxID=3051660 RepID=A0ABT8G8W8_9MICO|nr:phage baseplate assembly protein V [Demequina sp. SYSU T00192]MDN4475129.1 phage baseplate assembly protein V [Demequina sp. SYSU T00192]
MIEDPAARVLADAATDAAAILAPASRALADGDLDSPVDPRGDLAVEDARTVNVGLWRGLVTGADDPWHRGRIEVVVPEVLGSLPVWAEPSLDPLIRLAAHSRRLLAAVKEAVGPPGRPTVDYVTAAPLPVVLPDDDWPDALARVIAAQRGLVEHLVQRDERLAKAVEGYDDEHFHEEELLTVEQPIPRVGDGVWIAFEGGDPARPVWTGLTAPLPEAADDAEPASPGGEQPQA